MSNDGELIDVQDHITVRDREPTVRSASRLALAAFAILAVVGGIIAPFVTFEVWVLITQWVLILGPAVLYLRRHRVDFRSFVRWRPLDLEYVPVILLLTVSAYILNVVFSFAALYFLVRAGFEPLEAIPPPETISQVLTYTLVVAVSAGLCEEVLFRGAVMRSMEGKGQLPALVFSSFLFAAFHGSVIKLPNMFFLGLLVGLVVIKTRSIAAGILVHTLNNFFALIYLYWAHRGGLQDIIMVLPSWLFAVLPLLAIAALVRGLGHLQRLSPTQPLLRSRESWLPAGWLNSSTVVFVFAVALFMLLELSMGFATANPF